MLGAGERGETLGRTPPGHGAAGPHEAARTRGLRASDALPGALRGPRASPSKRRRVPAAPRGGRALVGTARRAVGLQQTPAAGGKGAASRRSQQKPWAW